MRRRMVNTEKSYAPGFKIGKPMHGGGVSEVIESKNASFPVGSIVTGDVGFEQYTVVAGAQGLRIIPDGRNSKVPLSSYVGVLGMPGKLLLVIARGEKLSVEFAKHDYSWESQELTAELQ